MKRPLLARLRTNAVYYLVAALLLVVALPLYESLVLALQGYGNALHTLATGHFGAYLTWVGTHRVVFLIDRVLLASAFALLLTFPFSLFRIIVAQEIIEQQEQEAEQQRSDPPGESQESNGMPAYAWRGKGFTVIAAWIGLVGLLVHVVGTVIGAVYLFTISNGLAAGASVPGDFALWSTIFSLSTNTVGVGLIAPSALFFGAVIARRGRHLWPGIWVTFGYAALAVRALLGAGAVEIANMPLAGQAPLTSLAILLFALWVLWFSVMLVRLQPEK